jgi:hypothetical protein
MALLPLTLPRIRDLRSRHVRAPRPPHERNVNEHHQMQTTASGRRGRNPESTQGPWWSCRPPRPRRHRFSHPHPGGRQRPGARSRAEVQRPTAHRRNPPVAAGRNQSHAHPGLLPPPEPRVSRVHMAAPDGNRRHHGRRINHSRTKRTHPYRDAERIHRGLVRSHPRERPGRPRDVGRAQAPVRVVLRRVRRHERGSLPQLVLHARTPTAVPKRWISATPTASPGPAASTARARCSG